MEDFSDILAPGAVLAELAVPNKKTLFQHLANSAEQIIGVDQKLVIDRLVDRERLGSTGFGAGVAIPHGKIEGLPKVRALFARLAQPIDFQAIDSMPVDLVFLLLSPPENGVEHLKALARVSRRLRDRAFVAKLRGAVSQDALYALLAGGEARNVA
ncbi:PTS sugar transporter subunit IIA [Sphingomonas sp. ID0503]|uniref:PTS sugar transporter subunit IIA n=1 Tax=Sphingomonas sp. ID0503 TaxID=3399691 RepID=UPI003AFB3F9E